MTLWRTYYHLVWATRNRHPLITPDLEPELYRYLKVKTLALNCQFHSLGGIADHVHLVVSIPPSRAIADIVKRLKGSSSHHINQAFPKQRFAWQREYAVFSLGSQQLNRAIAYTENQKQHHQQGNLYPSLEPDRFGDRRYRR